MSLIGLFLSSLPISISGLGTGHIAFQTLSEYYGSMANADIYNIFFLGTLFHKLTGYFFRVNLEKM